MTQDLFNQAIACAESIVTRFKNSGTQVDYSSDPAYGIVDRVFVSDKYRRAHVSIVDARKSKKLWLLHVTVFPHTNNPSPIYGFDIVCGPTKVSGAFHDFSWAGSFDGCDNMEQWFANRVENIEWNKKRELPDWAKAIFSNSMVAIGAVGPDELDAFIALGLETLDYYLTNVSKNSWQNIDNRLNQNRYCYYQKQNPHTPRVLVNLGFTEQQAQDFVQNTLFPEIR